MIFIYRTHDGHQIVFDLYHRAAVEEFTWRIYSHDEFRTCECATDVNRNGLRTTMMLSRFLMERILGRELLPTELVYRKQQKFGTMWDFRDKNLSVR